LSESIQLSASSPARQPDSWLVLMARLASGLLFLGAGFSSLLQRFAYDPVFIGKESKRLSWIPPLGLPGNSFHGLLFSLFGFLLLFGFLTQPATVASLLLLVLVTVEHLIPNPFFGLASHILPLFLLLSVILLNEEGPNRFALDRFAGERYSKAFFLPWNRRVDWLTLALRLLLGAVFLRQGLNSFLEMGLSMFAQKLYVGPFSSKGIPAPLLWLAGVTNPPIQVLGGFFLIVGFKTRWTVLCICLFLIEILFGHMVDDPLDLAAGLHQYSLANFFLALAILGFLPAGNCFSLDFLMEGFWKRKSIQSPTGSI
jgi:uncharacterized membrane protein YphA (DoxX/SURF4 family)